MVRTALSVSILHYKSSK